MGSFQTKSSIHRLYFDLFYQLENGLPFWTNCLLRSLVPDRNNKYPTTLSAHAQLGIDDVGVNGRGWEDPRNHLADVHPHMAIQNGGAILKAKQEKIHQR